MAGRADVDKAVDAAERAFPAWSRMAAADRGRILLKLADLIEAQQPKSWRGSSRSTPAIRCATRRALDVPRTAACFRYFGGMADKFQGDVVPVEAGFLNYLLREPVGVVGQVVPWNFPLMFTSWKMAPGAGGRQLHRAEAGRDHAAHEPEDRRADGRGRACPTAWSTSCPGSAAWPASTSPSTRGIAKIAFTGSRPRPAGASCRRARAT